MPTLYTSYASGNCTIHRNCSKCGHAWSEEYSFSESDISYSSAEVARWKAEREVNTKIYDLQRDFTIEAFCPICDGTSDELIKRKFKKGFRKGLIGVSTMYFLKTFGISILIYFFIAFIGYAIISYEFEKPDLIIPYLIFIFSLFLFVFLFLTRKRISINYFLKKLSENEAQEFTEKHLNFYGDLDLSSLSSIIILFKCKSESYLIRKRPRFIIKVLIQFPEYFCYVDGKLIESKKNKIINILVKRIKNKKLYITDRTDALNLLLRFDKSTTIKLLHQIIGDYSGHVRLEASKILADNETNYDASIINGDVNDIIQISNSNLNYAYEAISWSLTTVGNEKEDLELRKNIYNAIANLNDKRFEDRLLKLLKDGFYLNQHADIATTLAILGDKRAIKPILKRLRNKLSGYYEYEFTSEEKVKLESALEKLGYKKN